MLPSGTAEGGTPMNSLLTPMRLAVGLALVYQTIALGADTARMVDTSTSEVKYTVDSGRMTQIPLAGRNILALAALMPGVVSTGVPAGASADIGIFVNGNRSASMDFQLDGGNYSDESYLK